MILGAYAVRVADDRLDPEERVPLRDVERWYWPGTDGGAHEQAVKEWRESDEVDDSGAISLDQVAHAMIRWSDNAAADYMLDRVGGPKAALAIAHDANMDDVDRLMPVLGEFIAWSTVPLETWRALGDTGRAALGAKFASETKASSLSKLKRASPEAQFAFAKTSPSSTPAGWAQVMATLNSGIALPDPAARAVVRRHLEWPLEAFESNRERFERFGAKGGSLPGVLTEAMYVKPKGGDVVVVVLFIRDLSPDDRESLQASNVHQRFMLKLVEEPAFRDEVRATLAA